MRMKFKRLVDGTTEVDIKLLPDGRVCVHWLIEDDAGLVKLPGHPVLTHPSVRKRRPHTPGQPIWTPFRVACNPKQNTVGSQKRGNVRFICTTAVEIAGVTCPKCLATAEAIAALKVETDLGAAQLAADSILAVNRSIPHGGSTSSPDRRPVHGSMEQSPVGHAK